MGRRVTALVAVVALCHVAAPCNVRELSNIIQDRFRKEVVSNCGVLGDKCTFDRDCCKGLECKMSVSKMGVDNYCQQRLVMESPIPGSENAAPMDSGDVHAANEPGSPEDGAWMLAESQDSGGDLDLRVNEEEEPKDTLSKIDQLQEKKRVKLVREKEELEKLFTEKDEKELEQLRALKEDAEMDELRKLKELRLKRKLELLKELEELRGLKAEEHLNKLDELNNKTKSPIVKQEEEEEKVPPYSRAGVLEEEATYNQSIPADAVEQEAQPEEPSEGPLNTTFIETEAPPEDEQAQEPEATTAKLKQGIHPVHHRKRHHQSKHKKKSHESTGNSTAPETNTENKAEETQMEQN